MKQYTNTIEKIQKYNNILSLRGNECSEEECFLALHFEAEIAKSLMMDFNEDSCKRIANILLSTLL